MGSLRRFLPLVAPAALALLAACGSDDELAGRGYQPMSDVTVSRSIPLTVPPDFGLRPQPAEEQQDVTVLQQETDLALLEVDEIAATQGEQALMAGAGVPQADPSIRKTLQLENALLAGDDALVDTLLFGTPAGQAQQIQEGPEIGSDVAIDDGREVEDGTWYEQILDIF
jgi:hypothetical protein